MHIPENLIHTDPNVFLRTSKLLYVCAIRIGLDITFRPYFLISSVHFGGTYRPIAVFFSVNRLLKFVREWPAVSGQRSNKGLVHCP